MSGHSKWATIKHKKGAADQKRAKLFAKLIKQVEVAARQGGGDLDSNATLRTMYQKARDSSVPLDTIERAVKRGTGELEAMVGGGGFACAFSMHPTSIGDLMRIADDGGIMPPKSTWFEPKLRDGMFCHQIS